MVAKYLALLIGFLSVLCLVQAGTKSKAQSHTGILQPYDGKHIAYRISLADYAKLEAGQPVIVNERSGKDGRGLVIQDIDASPVTCMEQIRALGNYKKVVPKIKSVDVYENINFLNGTTKSYAEFSVGISLLTFNYFLALTFEPQYYTVTWTLDYRYSSDFDDNTGHWQVMPHPTKSGWSRVVYSTEVKVPSWIPEFVLTFLTKTALVESTAWVKKESEKIDKDSKGARSYSWNLPDISSCFIVDSDSARYETRCIEEAVRSHGEL